METDIAIVKLSADKNVMEDAFRKLWRECFEDPEAYEEFYFHWVYPNNTVYAFGEKGMLHLNPYLCVVGEEERLLHYIVGVGTKHSERRKGIMRNLLIQALQDMYKAGEPFTYLMPADVRYYEPFGFVSISEKKEQVLCGEQHVQTGDSIIYQNYSELLEKFDVQERQKIYEKINPMLSEQYKVYAKHDTAYFELLYQEKSCQGGDVVFCFTESSDSDNLIGFFAYSVNGRKHFVEQSVFAAGFTKDRENEMIAGYENLTGQEVVLERFPFMVRIINVAECMKVFPEALRSYVTDGKQLLVIDEEIPDNNGIYSIQYIDKKIIIEKQSIPHIEQVGDLEDGLVQLSISELTGLLFDAIPSERVYFAEVV